MMLTRPTRDIDRLGTGDPDPDGLEDVVQDCCTVSVAEDGITFDLDSITSQSIRAEARYDGQRLSVTAYLGTAWIPIQIDVGFGDVVVPRPSSVDYPTILDFDQPRLQAYSFESTIAETYQAMVERGAFNSRMKDFYDIWWLSQNHPFEGVVLGQAVAATFKRRGTPVPEKKPVALPSEFITKRTEAQWKAFYKKLYAQPARSGDETLSLRAVVDEIAEFLWPLTCSLSADSDAPATWPPGGSWQPPLSNEPAK